jgi:hypothetical protein
MLDKNSTVRLSWSGANGATVQLVRNGIHIADAPNTGSYADRISKGRSYAYSVCEQSGVRCSPTVTITAGIRRLAGVSPVYRRKTHDPRRHARPLDWILLLSSR